MFCFDYLILPRGSFIVNIITAQIERGPICVYFGLNSVNQRNVGLQRRY